MLNPVSTHILGHPRFMNEEDAMIFAPHFYSFNFLLSSGHRTLKLIISEQISNNKMFSGVNILILALFGLLAWAAPFKERSGAPINGMTLSVDSGKLCEGHQVNISWGDTSLGAVSCIHPEFSTLMLVASRHTIFKLVSEDTTPESTGLTPTITLLNRFISGTLVPLSISRCKSAETPLQAYCLGCCD